MLNLSMGLGDDVIFWVPGLPVFVDSRLESYPPDFLRAVMDAQSDDRVLAGLIDRFDAQWVFASHARPLARARVVALLRAGWQAGLRRQRQRHRRASDGHARDERLPAGSTRSICGARSPAISRRRRAAPPARGGLRGVHGRAGTGRPGAGRTPSVRSSSAMSAPGPTETETPRWLLVVVGALAAVTIVVAWGARLSWGLWLDETFVAWQAEGGWSIVRDKLGDPAVGAVRLPGGAVLLPRLAAHGAVAAPSGGARRHRELPARVPIGGAAGRQGHRSGRARRDNRQSRDHHVG